MNPARTETLHASCVAVEGRGLLILGPSGSGKSALALNLIALGADLVSDDRTDLHVAGDDLVASPPPAIRGLIEARGVGILRLPALQQANIALVVDLGQSECTRLPPQRDVTILGMRCDLVLGVPHAHFPAAILCYLKGSRHA